MRPSPGKLVEVHQRDLGDSLLQHADARLNIALPLPGGLILGVLPEIAELTRPLDLLWELALELTLESSDFVFESFEKLSLYHSR